MSDLQPRPRQKTKVKTGRVRMRDEQMFLFPNASPNTVSYQIGNPRGPSSRVRSRAEA